MEQSESVDLLTKALVKARAGFAPLVPDKTNPHYKSRYASLQNCIEVSAPALSENGLAVTQWLEPGPDGMMALTTQIQHDSGQWQRSTGYLPVGQATPQSAGSSLTYLRRYGYCPVLGLAPDEDDDANPVPTAKPAPRPVPREVGSPDDPGDYVLTFGKHNGKTIKQAGRHYAKYMLDTITETEETRGSLSPRDTLLREAMARFLEAYPLEGE